MKTSGTRPHEAKGTHQDGFNPFLNAQQLWPNGMPHSSGDFLAALREAGVNIDAERLLAVQQKYLLDWFSLLQARASNQLPALEDRRFSRPEWRESAVHAFNAAAYLLNANYLFSVVQTLDVPEKTKRKIEFALQQLVDAWSPANFFATNPEAQRRLLDSHGESLTRGIGQMLEDVRKGRISQTDESAFEVGKNVATTAGQVVFENALFQLIQYAPTTPTVHQRPLLMVPPCINKYYILDLQPENSLVRYALDAGHTVFLMSWANPDASLDETSWDQYIEDGVIRAIHVAQNISGQDRLNTFGFCVGGTLLSTALAVLAGRKEHPAASLTLLTSLLDFSDTGILDVFVDELHVRLREQTIGQKGLLPARDLANTFSSLRPNDLLWNYVQSNYLMGEAPAAFDLLYWNADGTNLPGPMFCWYLRNTYLENKLMHPGALSVCGQKIDLGKIDAPVFVYGSKEDHIVPWSAAFASLSLLNPKHPERNTFVLGASGHIAGVINPPAKNKRNFWKDGADVADAGQWLQTAREVKGSWWPEWADFLSAHAGRRRKAKAVLGNAAYPPIEAAPGRYVKVKALS